jgi:hypothetical protein
MSSQFCVNLAVERRPSRRLLVLYALLFGCAVLGVAIVDFAVLLKVVLFAVLCGEATAVWRRHILLSHPDSVLALTCTAEQWIMHTRDTHGRPVRLLSAASWWFDIIPLVFVAADGKRFTVLLTPDRIQPEPLRALRAWMRHRLPAA